MKSPLRLFDLSDCEKLKTPGQKEFEKNNSDILCAFPEMVEHAFERMCNQLFPIVEPISRGRNFEAVNISGFIQGQVKIKFPHLCRLATKTRFRITTEDGHSIYIKKLDHNLRPMWGKDTKNNTKIIHQLSETGDEGANIFLGYTAPDHMITFSKIYAVCIDGDKLVWAIDLIDFAAKQQGVILPMPSPPQDPDLKDGIVSLKKKTS